MTGACRDICSIKLGSVQEGMHWLSNYVLLPNEMLCNEVVNEATSWLIGRALAAPKNTISNPILLTQTVTFILCQAKLKCPQCHHRPNWREIFLWASAVSAICQESVFSKQMHTVSFTFDVLSQCPICYSDDFIQFVACNCWTCIIFSMKSCPQ